MDWTVWPVWPPYQFEIAAADCRKQKLWNLLSIYSIHTQQYAQEHACNLEGETCWSFLLWHKTT